MYTVIDLARLICGFCHGAYADATIGRNFFRALLHAAEWQEPWETPLPKLRDTNVLLVLRAIANSLQEATPVGGDVWFNDVSL